MSCPCQSGRDFESCCSPILSGQPARTAEELMRARYTAYTKMDLEFIEKTTDPKSFDKFDMEGNREWAKSTQWQGLEIVSLNQGRESDDWGQVEFKAKYSNKKGEGVHHELSDFNRRNGQWYFTDGLTPSNENYRREEPKIGRNDPCPCGSGKKYKKCCSAS